MKRIQSQRRLEDTDSADARGLRRTIVTAGLVLVGLVVILAAIYAGVFLILAPMMQ